MAVSTTSPNVENYTLGKGIIYWKSDSDSDFRHVGNVPEVEITLEVDKLEHFSSMEGVNEKDRIVVRTKAGSARMVLEELTPANMALMLMGTPSAAAVNLSTTVETTNGSKFIDHLADTTGLVAGRRYNITGVGIPAGNTFTYDGGDGGELDIAATENSVSGGVAVTVTGAIALEIFGTTEINGKLRYVGTNEIGPKISLDLNNVSVTPTGGFNPISTEWLQMEMTADLLSDSLGQFGHAYWRGAGTDPV